MDIIRRRQLEARLALRMEKLSKENNEEVVKTEYGYEWKDQEGNTLVSVKIKSF